MDVPFYGRCDTCGELLSSRYYSFNRLIEKFQYHAANDPSNPAVVVDILSSDHLTQYCSSECAHVGAYCQLRDRGITSDTEISPGPIANCSKCKKQMDLTHAHVAYELMDQTEIQQPWFTSSEPHDSATVAVVCSGCDNDLNTNASAFEAVEERKQLTNNAVETKRLELLK